MTQLPVQETTTAGRPGQMTTVMRAVATTAPRVLRVGVVRRGRVVEERILKPGAAVTVGAAEKNLFVVAGSAVPGSFRLLERVGDGYVLNFLSEMSGRVALPTGVSDLRMLVGHAALNPADVHQIRLTEDSRGKVVVGETTFLFQFVAPLPLQPRPQLPLAITQGNSAIDWTTTVVAALAFLLHFAGIGFMYSDWLDPIVDTDQRVQGLVETVKSLPKPPALEEPLDSEVADVPKEKVAESEKTPQAKGRDSQASGRDSGQMSSGDKAGLRAELESLELAILATMGEGPATTGVLADGEVAHDALDRAAASGRRIGIGGHGDLSIPGGPGTVMPGASGAQLAALGDARKTGRSGAGKVKKVKGPPGTAGVGSPNVAGGQVTNASSVVAGMRPGFRRCYTIELSRNPDAQGSIQLSIYVGPGGEVKSVSASPSGNLSGAVVSCIRGRASSGMFSPPVGGAAVIRVPVSLIRQ